MSIKKSIMLSDETLAYVQSREREENGTPAWSAAINGSVELLRKLLRLSCPELPMGAWHLILNAHCAHFFDWRVPFPMRLASDIMDDLGALSLDELEPDTAELVRLIHGLSQVEQAAVFEVVRIFWASERKEVTLKAMIDACRAKL